MGFRTSRAAETPATVLIIARVKINGTNPTVKSVPGADAMLLYADEPVLNAKNLPKTAKPLKDTPWGVYLDESEEETAALAGAGCDFLVISPDSRVLAVPQDEKTGKILQVESSMEDGLLRAVNDLPVDAVLITDTMENNSPLVWHQLMIYRHLTAFITKPLLVPVPAAIGEVELKALWDAGIDGVVAEADITGGDFKGAARHRGQADAALRAQTGQNGCYPAARRRGNQRGAAARRRRGRRVIRVVRRAAPSGRTCPRRRWTGR